MALRYELRPTGWKIPKPPAEGAVRNPGRPFIMLALTATRPKGDDINDSMPGSIPGGVFMEWR